MFAAQNVLYTAGNAGTFDASEFMAVVCRSAQQAFGGTAMISLHADSGALPNDAAMPLALVVNELLANAVKHGRRGRNRVVIDVTLQKEDESWILCVQDDGPGFVPAHLLGHSSGLGLVQGLVRQLQGQMRWEEGPGTRCSVRIPVFAAEN
jgi:two-component sensor histidine kinase